MQTNSIKLTLTNNYAEGCYTAPIYVGSKSAKINVFLDTGSSSLAISKRSYAPERDDTLKTTRLAQFTSYADGSYWQGPVIKTRIVVKHENKRRQLSNANVAIIDREKDMFSKGMQGILGLAYVGLDTAYRFGKSTWPTFDHRSMEQREATDIIPYFTQLERNGVVSNKFALYTLRSELHYGTGSLLKDPLNIGYCILGGGEEYSDLYTGRFKSAKVQHDLYYNTHIKSVRVGNLAAIKVKRPARSSGLQSNSIVDSGTSTICMPTWLFNRVIAQFGKLNPEFVNAIDQSERTDDVRLRTVDLKRWPNIYLEMEGEKSDIELQISPQSYWQVNCTRDGSAYFAIDSQSEDQTILGLPFMNNYFCVFERSAAHGRGVIKFAAIRQPDK